jgi:hypothetical protein
MAEEFLNISSGEKNQESNPEIDAKSRLNNCYKEINDYRRHYSHLRFALFPIYLTTQYGLVRVGFQPTGNNYSISSEVLLGLAGILITYVFWTIEKRIISYYKYLKNTGSELEAKLGYKLISEWPQEANQNIVRNTELSITVTFIIVTIFWLCTICSYVLRCRIL